MYENYFLVSLFVNKIFTLFFCRKYMEKIAFQKYWLGNFLFYITCKKEVTVLHELLRKHQDTDTSLTLFCQHSCQLLRILKP